MIKKTKVDTYRGARERKFMEITFTVPTEYEFGKKVLEAIDGVCDANDMICEAILAFKDTDKYEKGFKHPNRK